MLMFIAFQLMLDDQSNTEFFTDFETTYQIERKNEEANSICF